MKENEYDEYEYEIIGVGMGMTHDEMMAVIEDFQRPSDQALEEKHRKRKARKEGTGQRCPHTGQYKKRRHRN